MKKIITYILLLCTFITQSGCNSKSIYDEFALSNFIKKTSVDWGMEEDEAIRRLEKEFSSNSIVSEDISDNYESNSSYMNRVTITGNVDTSIGTAETIVLGFNKAKSVENQQGIIAEIFSKDHLDYAYLYINDSSPLEIQEALTKILGEMKFESGLLASAPGGVIYDLLDEDFYEHSFTLSPEKSMISNRSEDFQNQYLEYIGSLNFKDENSAGMKTPYEFLDRYLFTIRVSPSDIDSSVTVVFLSCGPLGMMKNFELMTESKK